MDAFDERGRKAMATIMVIDDDEQVRKLAKISLEDAGYCS
jgi:hypothetical protein